jgi:thiol-disulfide isomerase/thioredoxin
MSSEIEPTTFDRQEFANVINENNGILIFKFGAEWCGPCGRIKSLVSNRVSQLAPNQKFFEIDVDDSFDLYAFLKSKKIVQSIPTILAYYKENKTFVPDKVVIGANTDDVNHFFDTL